MMIRTASRRLPRVLRSPTRCQASANRPIARSLSCTSPRMASKLSPVDPPVSSALPADSYQLLSTAEKAGATEDALFDEQINAVKEWWASPRFEGIKRPYTPESVVSKRGSLQQTYPSSLMARKLFNLLNERAAEGKPVHTCQTYHLKKLHVQVQLLLTSA